MHRKFNRYKNDTEIEGLKHVLSTKVLGYQFNKDSNCKDHIIKIKEKIKKTYKMIYMSKKNELGRW